MIKAVVFDIDGVITDGKIYSDGTGDIWKSLNLKDLDSIHSLHRDGWIVGCISGEDNLFSQGFTQQLPIDFVKLGCKSKEKALEDFCSQFQIPMEEVCYIGDGKYDIMALRMAGLSCCPADAIEEVKNITDVILKRNGGEGCLADIYSLLLKQVNFVTGDIENIAYVDDLTVRYPCLCHSRENICAAYRMMEHTYLDGGKLLVAGNGGSAADAEHIVGELMKSFCRPRPISKGFAENLISVDEKIGVELSGQLKSALRAIALTTHEALSTAYMNDVSVDAVYAQQLYGYGDKKDVFLGISTSGNSKNILKAAIVARAMGIKVIALTGADGGRLSKYADVAVKVPETEPYKVQELHLPIYHCWCRMLEEKFFKL